jgi:bifunctional N-acetylglucosamine-1-phosphate-uridyltransferase/glucosamine-1-phosphate-acetyltransferase GlmU-like protein
MINARDAKIGKNSHVGPFANLDPGTVVPDSE